MRGWVWVVGGVLFLGFGQASGPRTPSFLDADADGIDDALDAVLASDGEADVLLVLDAPPTRAQVIAAQRAGALVTFVPKHLPVLVVHARASAFHALAQLDGVERVEADRVLHPQLAESVPMIGAPKAWQDLGVTGKGIVIAVLDDGVYEQHPDFRAKLAGHYDASGSSSLAASVDILLPAGEKGHATHVAGIAAGNGDESSGRYKGVAPDARIVNVRVFSAPNQTTSQQAIRGLDWTVDEMRALRIRIAVMSLSGAATDGSDALSRAVNVAVAKGLVVVASAGNRGPDDGTVGTPGAAANAITVGAVDKSGRLAQYSSRGPTPDGRVKPDVVAPGSAITSTIPPASTTTLDRILGGGEPTQTYYGPFSGTSMAAPHVAGLAALMLEANANLTPEDVKRILVATSKDLGWPGVDNSSGYGLVDAFEAVRVAGDPRLLDDPEYADSLGSLAENVEPSFLDRTGIAFVPREILVLGVAGVAFLVVIVRLTLVVMRGRRF